MNITKSMIPSRWIISLFFILAPILAILFFLQAIESPVEAQSEAGCPPWPIQVSDQASLINAIGCFNIEVVSAGTYVISLTNSVNLNASTPAIDNTLSGVKLQIEGNSFAVDGQNMMGVRPISVSLNTSVSINNLIISGGEASGTVNGNGGGIHNQGTLIITNSTIENNNAQLGGGIANSGTLKIESSILANNTANESGGGLSQSPDGAAKIYDTLFISNTAGSLGGAIYNEGAMKLTKSTLTGNHSDGDGGGIVNGRNIGNNAILGVKQTTLFANSALGIGGGYLAQSGVVSFTNSTLSGNTADIGGGVAGYFFSSTSLYFVTINGNTAQTAYGGIFYNSSATIIPANSIIANNSGGDCGGNGAFADGGFNLIEDGSCITATSSVSGDPELGPLTNNGGPTETHAPLPGSPVINFVPYGQNFCGTFVVDDQRDQPRPTGRGCDLGAYEIAFSVYLPFL